MCVYTESRCKICFLVGVVVKNIWKSLTNRAASLVAQMVKNLPAMQETRVQSMGQEDPVEKGMATHFSILAWRIPWTEEPGGLQYMGSQRVGHDWSDLVCMYTHTHNMKRASDLEICFVFIPNCPEGSTKRTSVHSGVRQVCVLSRVSLFATSWTVAYQAPPSMGFSRQECWSGLPFGNGNP